MRDPHDAMPAGTARANRRVSRVAARQRAMKAARMTRSPAAPVDRPTTRSRLSGYDDVPTTSAGDVGDTAALPPSGRLEQQLAMLAVRLEMAAVYLRLVRG